MSRYAVSTMSTDGIFFARGFLAGMRVDRTLDARSRRCAWFGQSLRSGKLYGFPVLGATGVSVRGLRPY